MDRQAISRKENIILDKSFAFAVRIVNLSQYLEGRKNFVLSKQILRSGTAIGAIIREAQHGESRRDFIHKMNVAIKESNETCYWLELLFHSNVIGKRAFESVYRDSIEILKILTAIINTAKQNI